MSYTEAVHATRLIGVLVTLLALVATSSLGAADGLELSFKNGRVTVIAMDVSVAAILQEWAQVGDTRFIDGDKLDRVRVRLEMIDVPESEALRVLLRDAAGYVTAPRAVHVEGSSRFDRVLVMATTRRQTSLAAGSPPTFGTAPAALAPAQGAAAVALPGSGFDDRERNALEELRELLPQPSLVARPGTRPTQRPGPTLPATASRPGMPVETNDDQAPVFIRQPVRPQTGDPR